MPRLARPRHAAALLAAGLLINSPLVRVAHADIGGCRSDPVVVLSNGVVVDLSAVIADDAADVRGVAYTLHVPAGLRAVSVAPSGGRSAPRKRSRWWPTTRRPPTTAPQWSRRERGAWR